MPILPNRNLFDGTKAPRPTTAEMKVAWGTFRDFIASLLGTDSDDKSAARNTLGVPSVADMQTASAVFAVAAGTGDAMTVALVPVVQQLTDGMEIRVRCVAANQTNSPTLRVGGLDPVVIVRPGGEPVGPGSYVAGWPATFRYKKAAAPGAGKFELLNPAPTMDGPIQGSKRRLIGSASGTNSIVNYSCAALTTGDANGKTLTTLNWSGSIDMSKIGAGGIDVGPYVPHTFYSAYGITKPDGTQSFIASLNSVAPSFENAPGFTGWGFLGRFRTGANNPVPMSQVGRRIEYRFGPGTALTSPYIMASGSTGSLSGNYVAVGLGAFKPADARVIHGLLIVATGGTSNAVGAGVSPFSNGAGGIYHAPNSTTDSRSFTFMADDGVLYYSSGGFSNMLVCTGWEENE